MVKRALNTESVFEKVVQERTVADSVYIRLRSDIVWGVLPPGAPLKSDEIRAVYDVGISPLREALTRLTAERLVTSIGQRGFRVAPLNTIDVFDTLETRILIETQALLLSINRGDIEWETRVVASAHALRRTPLPTGPGLEAEIWAAVHQKFHSTLISACGSPWLIQLSGILFSQADRHRIRAVRYGQVQRVRDRLSEHDAILDAAISRDVKRATAALNRHYRLSAEQVAEAISETPLHGDPPQDSRPQKRKSPVAVGSLSRGFRPSPE